MISVTTDYTENLERYQPVPWRPGFVLPSQFTATVTDTERPYRVELWLSVHDGEVECASVKISRRPKDGPPVTARQARLPLDRYIREAAVANAWKIRKDTDGRMVLEPMGGDVDDEVAFEVARPARQKTRWKMTDEHLKAVAEVYRANPKKPRQAILKDPRWAPIEPGTAARWIRAAKSGGFLEERAAPARPVQPKKRST